MEHSGLVEEQLEPLKKNKRKLKFILLQISTFHIQTSVCTTNYTWIGILMNNLAYITAYIAYNWPFPVLTIIFFKKLQSSV